MNKLYSIFYYCRGVKYCESATFFPVEIQAELRKLGDAARLVESNEVHDIYRVDID